MSSYHIDVVEYAPDLTEEDPWDEVVQLCIKKVGGGGTVFFPPRRIYRFKEPIHLVGPCIRLSGYGAALPGAGNSVGHAAKLMWRAGVDGVVIGKGHEMSDLALIGGGWSNPSCNTALLMAGRASLRRLYLYNWACDTACIEISADRLREYGSDCSGWRIEDCWIRMVGGSGHGIYVHGGDANAGHADQLRISDVEQGSAVVDRSFIGCSWIQLMIHLPSTNKSPNIIADHPSGRAFFANPYVESRKGGASPSIANGPTVIHGGNEKWNIGTNSILMAEGRVRGPVYVTPVIEGRVKPKSSRRMQEVLTITIDDRSREELFAGLNVPGDFIQLIYDGREDENGPLDPNRFGWLFARWRGSSAGQYAAFSMRKSKVGGGKTQ